jgi:hypothetical protein
MPGRALSGDRQRPDARRLDGGLGGLAADDLTLIPDVHENVFQKAFDTLDQRFFGG